LKSSFWFQAEGMFLSRRLALLISAALLAPPAFATNVHRHHHQRLQHVPTSSRIAGTNAPRARPAGHRSERVTQIQQALIREHYLTSEANGNWDSTTQAAMQKYQADNGWQTKLMPDSRASRSSAWAPITPPPSTPSGSSFAAPPSAPATRLPRRLPGFIEASGVHQ
jgi:hypothetical protein